MYSIVEACRYFLSTRNKRIEKISNKCNDMITICDNVANGMHVTRGLV